MTSCSNLESSTVYRPDKTVEGRFVTQPLKSNAVRVFCLAVSLLLLAELAEPLVALQILVPAVLEHVCTPIELMFHQ